MERLVQAEKECNDDIHKYSQDVNKQIHGILLDPRKEANRAMLDDISKIPREFINNGEKRWIELSKKRLLESSFGLQVQYPLHNSVRMAKFVRKC